MSSTTLYSLPEGPAAEGTAYTLAVDKGWVAPGDPFPYSDMTPTDLSLLGRTISLRNIGQDKWDAYLVSLALAPRQSTPAGAVPYKRTDLAAVKSRPKFSLAPRYQRYAALVSLVSSRSKPFTPGEIEVLSCQSPGLPAELKEAEATILGPLLRWFDPPTRGRKPGYEAALLRHKEVVRRRVQALAEINAQRAKAVAALHDALASRDVEMRNLDPNWKGSAVPESDTAPHASS